MKKKLFMCVILSLFIFGLGCTCNGLWKRSADRDGDGVYDKVDNCPNAQNPGQGDTDSDGIGDVCDNCPGVSNPGQANSDGDLIGDVCEACPNDLNNDQDGDGYCEGTGFNPPKVGDNDTCPEDFNPGKFQDLDHDGDGIPDACDNCPYLANGSSLGTCTVGDADKLGGPCTSAEACGIGGHCSLNQEDSDQDGTGDACGVYKVVSQREGSSLNVEQNEPIWDEICIENKSSEATPFLKPDCYTITTRWRKIEGSTYSLVNMQDIHGRSKVIPDDLVTLQPGEKYCITCDSSQWLPEGTPGGEYVVDYFYSNWVQDRLLEEYEECPTGETCYEEIFIGGMSSGEPTEVVIEEGDPVETYTAQCSFDPAVWYSYWAGGGGAPSITATVSGIDCSSVEPSSIKLNGSTQPISSRVEGNVLTLEFDGSAAVESLGNAFPDKLFATIQGKVGDDYFSGQAQVEIMGNLVVQAYKVTEGQEGDSDGIEEPLQVPVRVYSAVRGSCAASYGKSKKKWPALWRNCTEYGTEFVAERRTDAFGETSFLLPPGNYLILGEYDETESEPGDEIYIGTSVGQVSYSTLKKKKIKLFVDAKKDKSSGKKK